MEYTITEEALVKLHEVNAELDLLTRQLYQILYKAKKPKNPAEVLSLMYNRIMKSQVKLGIDVVLPLLMQNKEIAEQLKIENDVKG